MEFVVACGRSRGPPFERLAANGAIIHFGKGLLSGGFSLDGPRPVADRTRFFRWYQSSMNL
jgi:hypothetical protein